MGATDSSVRKSKKCENFSKISKIWSGQGIGMKRACATLHYLGDMCQSGVKRDRKRVGKFLL